jgi:DNA-directed RNA polymerase subunit H (RpoH/RPB5)
MNIENHMVVPSTYDRLKEPEADEVLDRYHEIMDDELAKEKAE